MNLHMYGRTKSGEWVPYQVDDGGTAAQPVNDIWSYAGATNGITNTSDVALVAASSTGNVHYLTGLQFINVHATVATEIVVKDGASTVIWRGYAPAVMKDVIAVHFAQPLRGSENTAMNFACVTTGTQTYVSAQGYTTTSLVDTRANLSEGEEIFADDGTLLLSDTGATLYLN